LHLRKGCACHFTDRQITDHQNADKMSFYRPTIKMPTKCHFTDRQITDHQNADKMSFYRPTNNRPSKSRQNVILPTVKMPTKFSENVDFI
jgi:hypothetical protein